MIDTPVFTDRFGNSFIVANRMFNINDSGVFNVAAAAALLLSYIPWLSSDDICSIVDNQVVYNGKTYDFYIKAIMHLVTPDGERTDLPIFFFDGPIMEAPEKGIDASELEVSYNKRIKQTKMLGYFNVN